MKILVQKTDLVAALKTADEATYKDATVDALRCVKIEAKDGAIRVVGNDLSLGIRLVLDGQIVEEGAAVFAAKSIVAFLKNAPAGVVRLETANADETTLRVSFRQTHIELQGEAHPDDCAAWLEADPAGTHALVVAEDLVEALRATLLAADETLDRPALRSVHMEIDHGVASFVATEGRRLHVMRIPTAFTDCELRGAANIPISVAKLLVKLFAKKRNGIRIRVQGQCVYFDCIDLGGIELYAKQNPAPYPEYEKILPKDETMAAEPIVVQSDELLAALDRIDALGMDVVNLGGGAEPGLVLSAVGENKKTHRTTKIRNLVPMDKQSVAILDGFAFDPGFLADAIRGAGTPEVFLRRNADNQLIVTGANFREKYLALLMSKRI